MVVLTLALWLKPIRTNREIKQRMDELAREYGRTPPEDPRRSEIFKELSGLCKRLDRLLN